MRAWMCAICLVAAVALMAGSPAYRPTTPPSFERMFEGHCAANEIFILTPPYSRSQAPYAAFAQPCANAIAFDASNGAVGITSGAAYGKLSIRIYRPPYSSSSVPTATFAPRGLVHPRSAAWDAAGNLWVADDEANRVFEFRPPFSTTTQAAKALTVATQPAGLAIDPKTRQMFVTDLGGGRACAKTSCRIDILDAPYTGKPAAAMTLPHAQPFVVAVDGSGRLFAGVDRGGASEATIDAYQRPFAPSERPAFTLHPGGLSARSHSTTAGISSLKRWTVACSSSPRRSSARAPRRARFWAARQVSAASMAGPDWPSDRNEDAHAPRGDRLAMSSRDREQSLYRFAYDDCSFRRKDCRGSNRAGERACRSFDCFYVYPTVSPDTSDNAGLQIHAQERGIAIDEASRFSEVCNVWVPIYRQITVKTQNEHRYDTPGYGDVAYASILSAWREYRSRYNAGRPIVFIGHSQGVQMLARLLRQEIEPNPALLRQVLFAILVGGNAAVAQTPGGQGSFRRIPACSAKGQTQCAIGYSLFDAVPPPDSRFGIPGQGASLQGKQFARIVTGPTNAPTFMVAGKAAGMILAP
jgi:DNA-binding beta-propeller fold protein YncE